MSELNRSDERHMQLVKGLYYAWYGPKDAVAVLKQVYGIETSISLLTRLFHNFRVANVPRHSRREILLNYLSATRGE